MRKLIGCSTDTFKKSVDFLTNLSLIYEDEKYPPKQGIPKNAGRKCKYLVWKQWEPSGIVDSIENLVAYQNLDLSNYPIRKLKRIKGDHQNILKKYIFRIVNRGEQISKAKINKIYELLSVETGAPIGSLSRVYNISPKQTYKALNTLMESGKIEFGYSIKRKTVVVYKNPEWIYRHERWKCENCGKWNVGSNTNYCGGCGNDRKQKIL